jgi:uncharacterized iron-regulated membrane protein
MSSLAFSGKPRQIITKLHRWSGLALAALLLLAALTGAVLSFRWEIDALLNPGLFKVEPGADTLPQSELISRVEAHFPELLVSSLALPAGPADALRVSLKAREKAHQAPAGRRGMKMTQAFNQAFVNPYTGEVLGQRNTTDFVVNRLNFVPFVLRLHYSLFLEQWGVWLMGGSALLWFVSAFLGLALSWPRQATALKAWRPIVSIRSGKGSYKLNYDLHRAASVLSFPILIVVAFTSVYLNLPELVKPVIEQFSPLGSSAPSAGRLGLDASIVSPEAASQAARAALPGARVSFISRDFAKGLYTVRLHLPQDVSPNGNNTIYVGMRDGAIVHRRLAAEQSAADTFIAWQVPLHAGTAFGLTGQILICLAAITLAAVCITGFNIWLRKQRSEKNLRIRRQVQSAEPARSPDFTRQLN